MSTPKIKICGVKDIKTAEAAVKAGANYIGLVFHPNSPRNLSDLDLASSITSAIHNLGATAVGVFVDQEANEVNEICQHTGITMAQLHGQKAQSNHHLLSPTLQKIYALAVNPNGSYTLEATHLEELDPANDFLLFDYLNPGSGLAFKHTNFSYSGNFKYFIAGGLNSENIAACIRTINPYAIDTSSGVESEKGVKSIPLIQQFIQEVNRAHPR